MAGFNRSRYCITVGDGWKRFSDPIPGCNMLGTIKVGLAEGALVRHVCDGSFSLVRPGHIMTLLARKVEAAMQSRDAA
jgi:hypothetical protein